MHVHYIPTVIIINKLCLNFGFSYNIRKTEMFRYQIAVKQPHPVTLLKTDLFPWNFETAIPQPDILF